MSRLFVIFLLLLVSCSNNDISNPTPPSNNACANVLRGSIDLPTTLVNTDANCDYLLEGELDVNSTLTIEAGVKVVATRSSSIDVREADLIAVGTPDKRIVFEGQEHLSGYWGGVALRDARPSRIGYVDIKDAGQSSSNATGGLLLRDVVISIENTSVSNSFVDGVYIDDDVELTSFTNNRFYGNAFSGLTVDGAENIPMLDKASDYLGLEEPNGRPYINLFGVFLGSFQTSEQSWKKLNAPYYVSSEMRLSNVILRLEPGVEVIFEDRSSDAQFISSAGLIAVGTADEPIIFRGAKAELDAWLGLEFRTTTTSVFEHTEIRDARRAIHLSGNSGSSARLSNSRITNSLSGVVCSGILTRNLLELGPEVIFNIENEDIGDSCVVESF